MERQTAVEFLITQISKDTLGKSFIATWKQEFEQAKQIEKELFTEGDVKIAIELANKNINRLSMKWTKEDIIREIKKSKTK